MAVAQEARRTSPQVDTVPFPDPVFNGETWKGLTVRQLVQNIERYPAPLKEGFWFVHQLHERRKSGTVETPTQWELPESAQLPEAHADLGRSFNVLPTHLPLSHGEPIERAINNWEDKIAIPEAGAHLLLSESRPVAILQRGDTGYTVAVCESFGHPSSILNAAITLNAVAGGFDEARAERMQQVKTIQEQIVFFSPQASQPFPRN